MEKLMSITHYIYMRVDDSETHLQISCCQCNRVLFSVSKDLIDSLGTTKEDSIKNVFISHGMKCTKGKYV